MESTLLDKMSGRSIAIDSRNAIAKATSKKAEDKHRLLLERARKRKKQMIARKKAEETEMLAQNDYE